MITDAMLRCCNINDVSSPMALQPAGLLRAVPEIILGGAGTFLSCGGGVLLTMCPRGGGVAGNLSWGSRHI